MEKPPDGYIVFCKRACETCATVVPALKEIAEVITALTIYCQDDPGFPEGLPGVVDDTALETSFHFDIETVPTLIRMEDGQETGRAVGWDRAEWRTLTGMEGLGGDLPEFRPGCGAKNVEPGIAEELAVRFGKVPLTSRRIESPQLEDDVETCFARGWTDGLPVVPPTEVRVVLMLRGTDRAADEIVGLIPPNQAPCTVEKVAINAVMAGCKKGMNVKRYQKPTFARTAPVELQQEISTQCDLVIEALAD
jgi:hypothetical protein